MARPVKKPSLLWTPLLVISATAFSVEIPFFFFGIASGHDFEFHLYSWLEVLSQWKQGIYYPRWAALAHFAYGEPRFIFYPPASWTLGAFLSSIFPWNLASEIYIWLVLVAAGASMFLLARRWLSPRDAMFAAALYAANPYHLVIVYWRSAFAELLASCLLPLLLLMILKARESGHRAIIPLALVLAAAWLTNAPAAVMIHYSLALLLVFLSWKDRSPQLLVVGAASIALGASVAAFYLFPAIYEQNWVNIADAISPGSRPQDNFLFMHTADADHDRFNHLVSWIAIVEILITFFAIWVGKLWHDEKRSIWNALVVWAAACGALMFPVSGLLWEFLPKLRFMQFPWRWLLCLSMLFTIFVTVGVRRWWARAVVYLAIVVVIVFVWHSVQPPWWDTAADLREMQDNMETGAGYEGTDEYTPTGADPSSVDKEARRVKVDGPQHAAIHVLEWSAESRLFTAKMAGPSKLALRLFNYPTWKVEVNGNVVLPEARRDTGQMLIPVQAGENRVQITFLRTWDRVAGAWISIVTYLCLILATLLMRKRPAAAQS
jgi:hypothetical protein